MTHPTDAAAHRPDEGDLAPAHLVPGNGLERPMQRLVIQHTGKPHGPFPVMGGGMPGGRPHGAPSSFFNEFNLMSPLPGAGGPMQLPLRGLDVPSRQGSFPPPLQPQLPMSVPPSRLVEAVPLLLPGTPTTSMAGGRPRTTSTSSEITAAFGGASMFTWQPELGEPAFPFSPTIDHGAPGRAGFGFSSPAPAAQPGGGGVPRQSVMRGRSATISTSSPLSGTSHGLGDIGPPLPPPTSARSQAHSDVTYDSIDSAFNSAKPWGPDALPHSPCLRIENVDPGTTERDLAMHFGRFGPIQAIRLLPESATCLLTFHTLASAYDAMHLMNGAKIGRFFIALSYAMPGVEEGPASGSGGQQSGSAARRGRVLQVRLMSGAPLTNLDLYTLFTPFGAINKCSVGVDGAGWVQFAVVEDASEAKAALDGTLYQGASLVIAFGQGEAVVVSSPPAPAPVPMQQEATPKKRGNPFLRILTPGMPMAAGGMHSAPVARANEMPTVGSAAGGLGAAGSSHVVAAHAAGPGGRAAIVAESPLVAMPTPLNADARPCYNDPIPAIPGGWSVDMALIRDYRRKLERMNPLPAADWELMFQEVLEKAAHYCVDLNGNVLVQKLLERGGDAGLVQFIRRIAPHFATISINKSGTWVAQKLIDLAKNEEAMELIIEALKPYTAELMMDTFGNYVVQGVLKLGAPRNQFILDALKSNCRTIALSRFGSRAMRTSLESGHVTKAQQKQIAVTIVQHCLELAQDANGAIIMTWLCDSSSLPGRYQVLASKFKPHIVTLMTCKQAHVFISKIQCQRMESSARQTILEAIFTPQHLPQILADRETGIAGLLKVVTSLTIMERGYLASLQELLCDPAYASEEYDALRQERDLPPRSGVPASPLSARMPPSTAGILPNYPKRMSTQRSGWGGEEARAMFSPMPSPADTRKDWRKF